MGNVFESMVTMMLRSPLATAWREQYARVCIPGLAVGAPAALLLNGVATPFQYTGVQDDFGAEIFLALSFAEDQARTLELSR